MQPTRRLAVFSAAALAISLSPFPLGCGSEDNPTSPNTTEVNSYLRDLPTWAEFADVADTADVPVGDPLADMSDQVLCSTTHRSITQNPEELVTFGSAPDVMYLGSLIQGNTYLGGLGSMEELPIRQRAPLTVALKLFTGTDITRTVTNPDAASVQAALNDMVAEAEADGAQSGSRIFYDYKESYSSIQAALGLRLSFKYMGASGRTALDFETSKELTTVTAFFKQIMFEAYIVRPQTPGSFFTSDFTKERLDEQVALGNIGPKNLPVYVARIQYGRVLLYSMTYAASRSMLRAAVEGSYRGVASVDAEIRTEVESILQNATIKVATIGGSGSTVLGMIRSGTLGDYFSQDDPLTTAEPLAYALYNLADGSLAVVSETTEYDVRECSPVNATCFLNKTEWMLEAAKLAGDDRIVVFPTTAENIALANEVGAPPQSNARLGRLITFDRSNTGFPFTFSLEAAIGGYDLVFDDLEGSDLHKAFRPMDQERSISIGDVDNNENDNFAIQIPEWNLDSAVFAVGITVGDNDAESGESISMTGIGGFSKQFSLKPDCPGTHGFIGIVSTVPITMLYFNENNEGDDIFVRDPEFGVIEWTD